MPTNGPLRAQLVFDSVNQYGEPFVNYLVSYCSRELFEEEEVRERLHAELLEMIPFKPWQPTPSERATFESVIKGIMPTPSTAKYPDLAIIINIAAILDAVKAYYGK